MHRGLRWALVIGALIAVTAVVHARLVAGRGTPEALLARQLPGAQIVDRPAPPLAVTTRDGQVLRLSDLRGKVVFVNFWATWCPPCRTEIPDLERLAKDLDGVPFEILAVSADASWEAIDNFFTDRPTRMHIALDSTKRQARIYGTQKLPETYVVDREGHLRLRFVGVQPWTDERIHRYLEWLATKG